MSAIAGFLQLDGAPADSSVIHGMVSRIAHRGPDGSGTHTDGPVALGHLLLQITPESIGERQPLSGAGGGLVITFDGRLDNREDLWESLTVLPAERGQPDAALVLRAYEKWGQECPVRLIGEFAFAIWDRRRRELFCARDAFGGRDFVYHLGPRRFAFSSAINGVLAVPGVPRRLDELTLGCQLGLVLSRGERTLYEGIVHLPPAHILVLSPGGRPQLRRYWELVMEPEIHLRSPEEYAEALRELIFKATRAGLRTNHPVAATLSGGLDSSGIACVAARELGARGKRLITVSNVLSDDFKGNERLREESDFIRSVHAQEPNMDPYWALGDMFPPIEFDDATLDRLGEPIGDNFNFRTRELVATAADHGARVLFGGLGGDMAASFTGGGWLEHLARRGRVFELVRQLRLQGRRQSRAPLRIFMGQVVRPLSPAWVRHWHASRRIGYGQGWHGTPIHPDFAARLKLEELRRELVLDDPPGDYRRLHPPLLARGRAIASNGWVANHCDTMEGPQPLLDRRIWEFAHRVPLEQFCLDGMPRSLYRRALADVLPEKILRRTTKGWFAPDYRQKILSNHFEIKRFMERHSGSDPIWQYVHRPTIEIVLSELDRPSPPNQWDVSYQLVLGQGLRMAHFVSWLQRTT